MDTKELMKIMKEIKDSGKTAQELFYEKAKQMGVDPESILKTLQSFK